MFINYGNIMLNKDRKGGLWKERKRLEKGKDGRS